MCVVVFYIETVTEAPSVLLGRVGGVVDGDLVVAGVVRVSGKVHLKHGKHRKHAESTKKQTKASKAKQLKQNL